jgi:hypothetical protein
MSQYRLVCITKPDPSSTHEFLTHIGYYESPTRPLVCISVEAAIAHIESNVFEFYVRTDKGIAYVSVARPFGRKPHLQTSPDRTGRDYLLSLGSD